MKRLASLTAVVLSTLLVAALVWQFRPVVVTFVFALAASATLRPLVDRQVERGWPRGLALPLIYALTLGLAFVIIWSLGPPLLDEVRRLADGFVVAYDRLWSTWPAGSPEQQTIVGWLPEPQALYEAIAGQRGEAFLQGALGVTTNLAQTVSQVVIILMMSLYLGADQPRFERLWLTLLPAEGRARAREVWRAIETGVGAYIRSELLQSILAGFLLGLGYWQMGLPYPVLLSLASALAWLIPWLGAVLALVPVVVAGLTVSPLITGVAVAYTVAVLVVLEFWVEPRLYNRRQISSLLVVLVVMAMGETFGLLGILVAPPLAAALQILGAHLLAPASTPAEQPLPDQYAALRERLDRVRERLATSGGETEPQLQSLVERLDALVGEAGQALLPPRKGRRPKGSGRQDTGSGPQVREKDARRA